MPRWPPVRSAFHAAELVKAHAALDKAVDAAYGYKGGKDDQPREAFLFALYQQLSAPLDVAGTAKTKKAPLPERLPPEQAAGVSGAVAKWQE